MGGFSVFKKAGNHILLITQMNIYLFIYLFIYLSFIFRASPVAYGSTQAKGQTGDVAADLHHSHSNAGS